MGYTHYFTQTGNIGESLWDEITRSFHKIISEPDGLATLAGGDGHYYPIIDHQEITFNGKDEDGNDQSHETMRLIRTREESKYSDPDFHFCKTAYKPYDKYVTALLCIVNHVAPGAYRIGSDGDRSEWMEGLNLASTIYPDIKCPIE